MRDQARSFHDHPDTQDVASDIANVAPDIADMPPDIAGDRPTDVNDGGDQYDRPAES